MDNIMEEVYKSAEMELERFCSTKLEGKADYEYVLSQGEAYKEILKLAKEKDVDMILIGTHGVSGLERVLFGSTAERVIREARCPVMMVNTYQSK
jgi:nucleotide-binding universal stress UspA family protein